MEDLVEDKQVVDLLTKLKNTNGIYPSEMLAARRQMYQRQVANVALGLGIGTGIKHIVKGGGNASGAAAAVSSKVLETVLIAAITLEAGTATYLYRDKIVNAVKAYLIKPTAQEVASPSTKESVENPGLIPNTQVTPSEEPSATPSGSPSPVYAGPTTSNNANGNNGNSNVNANATPDPGGNNGNQYGLTPKPERTKDTGGSNNNGGGAGNNGGGSNNNGGGNKKP